MTIHQISLFLENKPGHLASICHALADASINLETLSLADTQSFGIVRLVTANWEKAIEALKAAGFSANVREVLGVRVPDRPGGMAAVLDALDGAGINIEYMYAFSHQKDKDAVLVLRVDDNAKAEAALAAAGLTVVGEGNLPE